MEKNTGSSKLVENIRAAMSPSEISSSNKGQYGIASLAADMSKSLSNNTEVIQTIINEQGDATRDEFIKLVKLMTSSQNKKGEELQKAVGEIIKQVAKLKLSAGDRGEELEKNLGLNNANKTLNKGSWLKEKFNVDQNKTGFDAIKQAFTMDSMFGTTFNKNKKSILEKRAGLESQQETQEKALDAVTSKKALNSGNKKNKKDKDGISVNSVEGDISVNSVEGGISVNSDKGGDNTTITKEESASGIDAASELEKQTDKLNEILEELYSIEDAVRANSDSIVEDLAPLALSVGAITAGLVGLKSLMTTIAGATSGVIKNVATTAVNAGKSIFNGVRRASTAVADATVAAGKSVATTARAVGPRLMSVASKVAAPLALGMSAYDTAKTSTDDYAERFGFDPVRGTGAGSFFKELGIRGLGAASDIGNTMTAGIAGDYLFQDKKSKAAAVANEGVSITQAQTGTVDRSNPSQGNSSADIAKEEPSISNPVPVAIVSAVERGEVIPTASAIGNMTERAAVDTGSNSGQTIINNITNNTTNPTSTPILTAPISPRNRNLGPMWQSQY